MVLNLTASPTLIPKDGTSLITADLSHDSNGNLVSGFPDGLIYFATTLGVINNPVVLTSHGIASTILGSGDISGVANVTATDNPYNVPTIFTLVTIDTIPPTVTTIDPTNNTVNVPANKIITITFNEPIKTGNGLIQLTNGFGTIITITTNINNNTLTITPNNPLIENNYTVILHSGSLTDIAGNPVAEWNSNFIVGKSPTVTSIDPCN